MQVDALSVRLRPRPMAEAVDLGVLLVHTHARSIARVWLPLWAGLLAVALATAEIAGWLPWLVIFCAKPWLDRSLLFVLSRAVFGEATRWSDLWAQRSAIWWRGLAGSLTLQRLSPWRSYTQAVLQLEGQRGKAASQRRAQILRGKRGAAGGMQFVFANVEVVLYLGLVSLMLWFAPEGTHRHVFTWLTESGSIGSTLSQALAYALAVLLVEPFFVAAGFLMYLNRRVELEAWDIEQEFRRAFA
ncbi:MAG TPA: hypothetical protein VF522_24185 [Ramlibacter sp.]|uniref:hypothetical protein n=1 Tax=Ramlibacter sp. TaxID=1917967 RepID=UPI002ED2134E